MKKKLLQKVTLEDKQKKWFFSLDGKPLFQRREKSLFLVLEGLDGSGQTTQSNLLKEYLEKKGRRVLLTKEPTLITKTGREIRRILEKEKIVNAAKLQALFAEDRKEHLKKEIIPALKSNKVVISDRYFLSSLAYGTASGVDLEYLILLNKEFLQPDLTFLLKVSPRICIERIKKRGEKETLFEEEDRLKKIWQQYKVLTKKFNDIIIINGEKSIKEVAKDIKKVLNQYL